ncbi:MAG TPA: helix-turn-helix transcriptional regulator [Pseudonocardiaceae bacterium]|nr:helix-turn-helix transcriptional regulator [Pseudonocardiaceae bacterium]
MDADDALSIGARVRMIRRRRGLSLDVVAGLAGITKPYLSMLERGQRGFNRRGLVENLAAALGCSVGRPDRATLPTHGPQHGRCTRSPAEYPVGAQ